MTDANQVVYIRFLFVGEGPFDEHLVTHLRRCCILAGADEAEDVTVPSSRLEDRIGRTVANKLRYALEVEPNVNLIFVHRDADSLDPEPRYEEIREAIQAVGHVPVYVAVVPIQETEAWLLLNEAEIRRVAENPRGTVALDIPSAKQAEGISSPKEHLNELILQASGQTGRRYRKMKQKVRQKCLLLIDGLDPTGPVCEIPSWKRMFSDLKTAVEEINATGR